jgi:hypothetical protein
MLTISPQDLHWLSEGSAEDDLCAHGGVSIELDGSALLQTPDADFTLSAAALYLLRTLSSDHGPSIRVGEHLIPHCGHAMWAEEGSGDVTITGCNIGLDWTVQRRASVIQLGFEGGRTVTIPFQDWQSAVVAFSDTVQTFYDRSNPKRLPADRHEREGFDLFLNEWRRRRASVERAA